MTFFPILTRKVIILRISIKKCQNLKKMTFSPRNCQSRHSILYVNWVRACRTNLHGCGSRDDQTRPLFERTNCQFLKIITYCPKSESHKNDLFSPKLSIATFHLVRELGPGLSDKLAWLRVTRRPNSTPVWAYELSISQNNYILSQVRISKKWPFLPETVNRDILSCT